MPFLLGSSNTSPLFPKSPSGSRFLKREGREGSYQEKEIHNLTETCHCQPVLSHSIKYFSRQLYSLRSRIRAQVIYPLQFSVCLVTCPAHSHFREPNIFIILKTLVFFLYPCICFVVSQGNS